MKVRKIVHFEEQVFGEGEFVAPVPVMRVAVAAILHNPCYGRHVEDLSELFDIGGQLGEDLSASLSARLTKPAVSYGKAAIVGARGEFEHGGALIHPKLGAPMRAALGGGKALIPSNVKVGPPGAVIDVPLGHKDEAWSFDHFDTMSFMVGDSPRPEELMMIIAMADGGRIHPRCGTGPVTD